MTKTRRLPPLHALRALEALYLTGSVTRAADYLNVTHSAVSHHIGQIEKWSGRVMVQRVGRQSRLTEEGESLARVAREAFDAIRHEVDRLPLRTQRPVTIAALPIVASEWLMPQLPGMLRKNPEISVHVSYALSDRPLQPEADIIIAFGRRETLGPEDFALLPGEAAPVCSPDFLKKCGNDPERALLDGPHLHDEDMRIWSDWMDAAALNPAGGMTHAQIYVEGSSLLRIAALEGHGVAICRLALVQKDIERNRLVQLSPITSDHDWVYFVRSNALRRADASVGAVLSWFAAGAIGAP